MKPKLTTRPCLFRSKQAVSTKINAKGVGGK
uniref:Uncharacterized protein n=1 Tax=Rhizophora mucronata TaxID=61149 RepID=A0A2P2IXF2_RHIMU